MESCDVRTRAYKNGKTFDECRQIAEKMNLVLQGQIQAKGKILWTDLLEQADHDEIEEEKESPDAAGAPR